MHERGPRLALMVAALFVLSGSLASKAGRAGGSEASSGPIAISGRVGDLEGSAVEGARVTLIQMVYAEGAFVPDPKVVDERTTASDGTFTLTIPQGVDPMRGGYVVARKGGLALGWAQWRLRDNRRVDLLLGEGKDLAGQVVDERGGPVAGAEVRVSSAMMGQRLGWRSPGAPEFLRAETDDDGRFLFADMPIDGTFEFVVEKPGRALVGTLYQSAPIEKGFQFTPGQKGIRIVLPPEAAIEGVVIDKAGGNTVGGVNVIALPDSEQYMQVSPRQVVSAADGAFRIGGLAAGRYLVQTPTPKDRAGEWSGEPLPVVLTAGETARGVKLEIGKGAVIEAFVADASGKAIADASVMIYTSGTGRNTNGVTDANGLTRIRVKAGQHSFQVGKEGYLRQMVLERVTVDDGEIKRIEYTLRSFPRAGGVVRDEAGNPLAGVRVSLLALGSGATSDEKGRFEVTGDSRSLGWQEDAFILLARDVKRDLVCAADFDGQQGDLDLTLQRGVTVKGVVLSRDGKPLSRARVYTMLQTSSRRPAPLGAEEMILTGKDGGFEIETMPADRRCVVTATAKGHGTQSILFDTFDLKNHHCDIGELRLPPADLSIAGVVVDQNGTPVPNADVRVLGDGQPDSLAARTDAAGNFVIQGVCAGVMTAHVTARGQEARSGVAQVEGGDRDLKIVVSSRSLGLQRMSREPASLKGKPLPPLKDLGIDLPADAEGRMLLLCFWDVGQRPSRNCVTQLAARATQLGEKEVTVVAVQAAKSEGDVLKKWIAESKIPFCVGQIKGDIDKTRFAWGAVSLPHLILTDKGHVVLAESFSPADLDDQIEAAAGR